MMIEAVIYGFNPSAKIDRRRNAPPLKEFSSASMSRSKDLVTSADETPGIGTGI